MVFHQSSIVTALLIHVYHFQNPIIYIIMKTSTKRSVRFTKEEVEPSDNETFEENQLSGSDSDEAPDSGSLKSAKCNFHTDIDNKDRKVKGAIAETKQKLKEKRKLRHEKYLTQKKHKVSYSVGRQKNFNGQLHCITLVVNPSMVLHFICEILL